MSFHESDIGSLREPLASSENGIDMEEDDKQWTNQGHLGSRLKHYNPSPRFLLGPFSVFCIIANRMIGSGIFLTPSTLIQLTQSIGITLLFWVAGAITTLCGALMFMEYGLTSPRFRSTDSLDGRKKPLPRSGGDMFYLKDVIKKPNHLAVCLYGIAFLLLGNVATNSISFGVRVLQAANQPADGWGARAIALVAVTFTCILHGVWRRGGIWLSNIFAVVKVSMLFLMFITGCLTWGGVFKRDPDALTNMTSTTTFQNPSGDAYAFAEAYLAVVFAFGGFNQANYVLGEISNPRKNYKWPAFLSVLAVSILYLLVNVAYMLVVPAEAQKAGVDVALTFFKLTYGSISPEGDKIAPRILAAFMAVSALGNIIVMTYTASRVKQEIAKEGILPFQKFFANNKIVFGAVGNPVPVGALVLHWVVSALLILGSSSTAPLQAYKLFVGLYSYTIDAIFGALLAAGIYVLRFRRGKSFSANSFLPGWLSIAAATLYGLSMAFPVVTSWVPPSDRYLKGHPPQVPWYTVATVSWCCVALGAVWWVGFAKIYPRKHPGMQLVIRRTLVINDDNVMDHETLDFDWLQGDDGASTICEDAHIERTRDNGHV